MKTHTTYANPQNAPALAYDMFRHLMCAHFAIGIIIDASIQSSITVGTFASGNFYFHFLCSLIYVYFVDSTYMFDDIASSHNFFLTSKHIKIENMQASTHIEEDVNTELSLKRQYYNDFKNKG